MRTAGNILGDLSIELLPKPVLAATAGVDDPETTFLGTLRQSWTSSEASCASEPNFSPNFLPKVPRSPVSFGRSGEDWLGLNLLPIVHLSSRSAGPTFGDSTPAFVGVLNPDPRRFISPPPPNRSRSPPKLLPNRGLSCCGVGGAGARMLLLQSLVSSAMEPGAGSLA
jgi:hypothetical protein